MKLLLHTCCGPCASHCLTVVRPDYDVTLFFSNSNIWPEEEYDTRRDNARTLAAAHDVPLVVDAWDHDAWREWIAGLEGEPEGGERCERCFMFNLARAGDYAEEHGFDAFTTTLTVSPHKDAPTIFRIGGIFTKYTAYDFKKKDGFRHSVRLSKELGLYRQDYCGCEFSMRDARGDGASSE